MYPYRLPLLAALLALALAAPAAGATSFDPAAIARGEQFWAPYNDGAVPCAGTLTIVYEADQLTDDAGLQHPAWTQAGARDCVIHVWAGLVGLLAGQSGSAWIRDYVLPYECATIAHEIGHNYFGLSHVDDPTNIMDGTTPVVPAACHPPAAKRARTLRARVHHGRFTV